ncbi:MAG: hypothetical protein JRJ29_00235 [Deltaproteobacteria bacterium]|nr:hypothetical protein [Deltaproteobacteria bacterium]MBW2081591.1 hypothetical protein [Deltaproteobacteria bacterium]
MAIREEVYERWGPMLLEAIVRLLVNEINILRQKVGLPPRTMAQVLAAVLNEYNSLEEFDFVKEFDEVMRGISHVNKLSNFIR